MGSRFPRASWNPKSSPPHFSRPPRRQNKERTTRTSLQNEVPSPHPSRILKLSPFRRNSLPNHPQRPRSSARSCTTGFLPSLWSFTALQQSTPLREDSSSRTQNSSLGSSTASSSSLMRHSRPTRHDTGRRRDMLLVAASRASTSSISVTGSRRRASERVLRLARTDRYGQ